jgi:uncharacterized protein (DUF1810 family)
MGRQYPRSPRKSDNQEKVRRLIENGAQMSKPHGLERFVQAQQPVYDQATDELRAGRKRSHWMWFIFPQIKGLGRSEMAKHYAISSKDEAAAYLVHPVLGPRLEQCAQLVLAIQGKNLNEIFGDPDDMKFHSSMTLFASVAGSASVFQECLKKYCGDQPDPGTAARLAE